MVYFKNLMAEVQPQPPSLDRFFGEGAVFIEQAQGFFRDMVVLVADGYCIFCDRQGDMLALAAGIGNQVAQ